MLGYSNMGYSNIPFRYLNIGYLIIGGEISADISPLTVSYSRMEHFEAVSCVQGERQIKAVLRIRRIRTINCAPEAVSCVLGPFSVRPGGIMQEQVLFPSWEKQRLDR